MIDQEQQKHQDETTENAFTKEKDLSKESKPDFISFKIYTDFISQSALFVQIVLCWYLLHLQLSGSVSAKKFGLNFEFFQNVSIDINTLLWSLNIVGFLIVLVCVSNHSKKMFFLHFFPFIGVIFFVIIAFYFHIVILKKAKNLIINPLSYIIIGGMVVAGLEILRNTIDQFLFLIGLLVFVSSNFICWLIERQRITYKNSKEDLGLQQSSFCGGYFLEIIVELVQFTLQVCLLITMIWVFNKLDCKIELIPQLIIGCLQLLNYILFRFSYSHMKLLNKDDLNLLQQANPNQNHSRQVSHYVLIYYINLLLFFSLLFCVSYYIPKLLNQSTSRNPSPSNPNTTHPIPPPIPKNDTNTTSPFPKPKNETIPNPPPNNGTTPEQPPKNGTTPKSPTNNTGENPKPKNNTETPTPPKNPKNDTQPATPNSSKNETFQIPKNLTKVSKADKRDVKQNKYKLPLNKNSTISNPQNTTLQDQNPKSKDNKTDQQTPLIKKLILKSKSVDFSDVFGHLESQKSNQHTNKQYDDNNDQYMIIENKPNYNTDNEQTLKKKDEQNIKQISQINQTQPLSSQTQLKTNNNNNNMIEHQHINNYNQQQTEGNTNHIKKHKRLHHKE